MAGDSWLSQIKDKFYGSDFYFQVTEHLEAKQAQISAGGDFHFQVTEYLETKQAQISAVTNQISTVASQVFSDLKTSLTVKFKSQRAPPEMLPSATPPPRSLEPITQTYKFGDIDLGEEMVETVDAVDRFHEIQERKGLGRVDDSDVKEGWARSSYFRDLIKKYGFEEACNRYIALPVNMRYQTYQKSEGAEGATEVKGFARLGVITDPRNGFVHLKELQDLRKGLEKGASNEDKAKVAAKRVELMERREKAYAKKNENQIAALNYALNQISSLENIDQAIEGRKAALQDQFLQLVAVQAEANPEKLEGDAFTLIHLGLLNPDPNNAHFERSGWMHNEMNAMLDMAAIFEAFEGKELILDGKGPLVDSEGIHLAIEDNGRRVKLNPVFCNISTHGHYKNDGVQREINEKAYKKLEGTPEGWRLRGRLLGSKSNYEVAEDLGALLWDVAPFSAGCLSAKDRTGFVAARLVLREVRKELDKHTEIEPSTAKRYSRNLARKILDSNASATQVVRENTGANFLKLHFTAGWPEISFTERVSYILKQIKGLV